MLSIKDIKTIVKAFGSHPEERNTEELTGILVAQLFEQTNLKSITEVGLVLDLYETTKTKWLKDGLENVLLRGGFPAVTSREVGMGNTDNPYVVPTQSVVWPTTVPPVKFEHYCNDCKIENLTKVK